MADISEQTFEYTPPEALLNSNWFQGSRSARLKYDIWSVGVVMLELMMGSPHVFQISDRTRILMDQHLGGWSEQTKELAYKLRSYMELCILVPGISSQHHGSGSLEQGQFGLASWKCSEESFAHQVKIRDPLKIGFPNLWALRLARQLLVWHPEDRLSVDEALNHPYFQEPM
uniref:Protein kinase domain-containing protein n=1 Tax=Zea mays TaxID=4577 RepID=A0A804MVI4_MAIZE